MPEKVMPNKRGRKPTLDPELVAGAIAELQGNVAAVAKRFGVDRAAVAHLIDKRPNLQIIVKSAREGMLDNAESSLYRAVIAGEAWAVCFFLKTQGKSRGYIEKQEIEHTGEANLTIKRVVVTRGDRRTDAGNPVLPEAS